MKKWQVEMKTKLPELFVRKGRIKNHKIHARLHEGAVLKRQKGRRVPIQLQEAVKKEIKRLLQEGHIVKVGNEKKTYTYSCNPQ